MKITYNYLIPRLKIINRNSFINYNLQYNLILGSEVVIEVIKKKNTVVTFIFSILLSFISTTTVLKIILYENILVNTMDKIDLFLKFFLFIFLSLFLLLNFNVFNDFSKNINFTKKNKLIKIARILLSIFTLILFYVFLYNKYSSMGLVTIIYYSFFYEYLLLVTLFSIFLSTNITELKKFIIPIQKYFKQKIKLSYVYLFFVSPLIGFALMEILNLSTFESIDVDFLFINYLLYTVIHVFFYIIFRRIKLTSFVTLMVIYYAAIANYFVINFRGIPIVFGDIYSIKTAFSVSGGYDFTLNSDFTTSVLLFSAAAFLLLVSSEKNFNK